MRRPAVLLLLPTTTYRAEDLLRAADAQGVDVIVGSDGAQALERQSGGATATIKIEDPELASREIAAIHARTSLSAVIGLDDETVVTAAAAAAALGLPHADPAAVATLRDKLAFRRLQRQHDLPHPDFVAVPLGTKTEALARLPTFPCVVKPAFLSASRGVIRADTPRQLGAALDRIYELLARSEVAARAAGVTGQILIERFVPGPEVAFEGLLSHGRLQELALFDKPDPLDGPFFEETLYVTPSRLPQATQVDIQDAVATVLAAAGLRRGPVHAEVRLDPVVGPTVIEAAARSIGGLCGRVLRFATGQSIEEIILRHALGLPVRTALEGRAAGVMMLPIARRGTLRRVEGQAAARTTSGVQDLVISIRRGQQVEPLPEGNRYLGFLFARGETAEQVEVVLRQAYSELRIVIG